MAPEELDIDLDILLGCFDGGDWKEARTFYLSLDLEIEQHLVLWSYLDSRQRAFLKNEDRKYLRDE